MKLLNIVTFFVSSILMTLWLYLFFSRKLRNITLFPLQPDTVNYIKTFFVFSISLFFLSLAILLYKKFIYPTRNKNSLIAKSLEKFYNFIDKINIFYKSYGMLLEFWGLDYSLYIITFAKFVMSLKPKQIFTIIFCFATLPRCIILLTFLIEIYFGRLHYFFYTLFLIIIPLFFRLLVFILSDVGPRLFPELDKLVIKKHEIHVVRTANGIEKMPVISFSGTEELDGLDFEYFAFNYYYPLLDIESYMYKYFVPLYAKFVQYTLLSYFFIITCGLLYILYCN